MKSFTSFIAARTYVAVRHEMGFTSAVVCFANGLYWVQL